MLRASLRVSVQPSQEPWDCQWTWKIYGAWGFFDKVDPHPPRWISSPCPSLASPSMMAVWLLWGMLIWPYPQSRMMLNVPMAALWVWMLKLRWSPGVWHHLRALLTPFLAPHTLSMQELRVPWHPAWMCPAPGNFLSSTHWNMPPLGLSSTVSILPMSALCYNCLNPQQQQQKRLILTLVLIEHLMCSGMH